MSLTHFLETHLNVMPFYTSSPKFIVDLFEVKILTTY